MWKYMYIHAYTYWHHISGMAGEIVLMVVDDDEQVWEVRKPELKSEKSPWQWEDLIDGCWGQWESMRPSEARRLWSWGYLQMGVMLVLG